LWNRNHKSGFKSDKNDGSTPSGKAAGDASKRVEEYLDGVKVATKAIKIIHTLLYLSHERANVIHLCAPHFLDDCFFIEDVIAIRNTHIFLGKMDDCPLP
jgi:hypothetical protein